MHMSEVEGDSGFEFTLDGCYKGDKLTLGRGDGEAATSLDFDLPRPTDPVQRANWENLNRYRNYILTMEENFHEPVVYLVNVKLLGEGYSLSTAATKHKFPIPIELYPVWLEGLAFVPDLTDGIYLGTLFMGTQKGTIHSCKIPLGDDSYPVDCSERYAQFSVHIDMLEYGELASLPWSNGCRLQPKRSAADSTCAVPCRSHIPSHRHSIRCSGEYEANFHPDNDSSPSILPPDRS